MSKRKETAITLWQHETYFDGKKVSERTALNF